MRAMGSLPVADVHHVLPPKHKEHTMRMNSRSGKSILKIAGRSQGIKFFCAYEQSRDPTQREPGLARRRILENFATIAGVFTIGVGNGVLSRTSFADESPFEGAYVQPALSMEEYITEIYQNRGPAFEIMWHDLEAGNYRHLSNSLVLEPFDALRQALFFIPWVLLKDVPDEEVGITAQLAYLDFKDKLLLLDRTAQDCARYIADEEDLQAAIQALDQSVDMFLSKVPNLQ